ncbi:MAG: recombination regulator RecX [Candidatus Edwardsbacteria bacterium]|jgi:regulatory protein|nr:recombination regulator RecX [Candidatus Edwardsbacteria bacterium]
MAFPSAREYALRLLAIRPRTVRELRDKLARRGHAPGAVAALLADLSAIGLLDDARFAKMWIEGRAALKPMGQARLRAELSAKGVDRGLVDEALAGLRDELDEPAAALKLAQRKARAWRDLAPEARERRISGFLGRRGYSGGVISATLKKLRKGFTDDG